jgi:hypothetical protein
VARSDQIRLRRNLLRPILFETFLRRALHRNINRTQSTIPGAAPDDRTSMIRIARGDARNRE